MANIIPLRMSSEAVMRPDNLNYKAIPMTNGRYRMRKVPLNNQSSSTITLTAGATQMVEFKLPAGTVFNTGRSKIEYVDTIPRAADTKYQWSYEDTFAECQSIQFCDASGIYLTDLQYANNYVHAVRKIDTDKEDFESSDYTSCLYKSLLNSSNYFPPTFALPLGNPYNSSSGIYNNALTPVEPQYVRASPVSANAGALGAHIRPRSIPLSCFTQTAVGMDKDVIFPTDMYIRIQIAPSSKVGFSGDAGNDPTTVIIPLSAQPVISNFVLQLAMQVDPIAEASIRQKFLAGEMKYMIPYVYAWRNPTSAGAGKSIQISLNNQWGNKLKRLIHVPFAAVEGVGKYAVNGAPTGSDRALGYDHCNVDGVKITSYQTFLDSQPLQDSMVSCKLPAAGVLGMDDWRENGPLLRQSALESSLAYSMNWCHIDSFSQPKRGKVLVPDENIVEGLDLTFPRQWTFTCDTAVDLNHYTFGTFTRQVVTGPQGTVVLVA